MKNLNKTVEAAEKLPDVLKLALRLRFLNGVICFLVSLMSFGMLFYSWYLIITQGFSWEIAVSMALALVFGFGFNGMLKT